LRTHSVIGKEAMHRYISYKNFSLQVKSWAFLPGAIGSRNNFIACSEKTLYNFGQFFHNKNERQNMFHKLCLSLVVVLIACKTTPKSEDGLPAGDVAFKAPDGWIAEAPNNPMRKAQYKIPGSDGAGDGELGVFFFEGAGGSVEANLDRWYGQFKQPDGTSTKDKVQSTKKNVNGLSVTVVYVTGNYMKPRVAGMMGGPVDETPNYAMHAAIVETANGPWFFKSVGPQATIDKWSGGFEELVNSFQMKTK